MMLLYRLMKNDSADGGPLVGIRRGMLGLRPNNPASTIPGQRFDTLAVVDTDLIGHVHNEGLSAYDDPQHFNLKANEHLWQIDVRGLPSGIAAVPDKRDNGHWLLVPSRVMTLGEFQALLASTRNDWKPCS